MKDKKQCGKCVWGNRQENLVFCILPYCAVEKSYDRINAKTPRCLHILKKSEGGDINGN